MAVATPCIRLCVLDDSGRLCLGCGRTIAEIGAWGSLSDGERRAIMTDLPRRLASARSPDEGVPPGTGSPAD